MAGNDDLNLNRGGDKNAGGAGGGKGKIVLWVAVALLLVAGGGAAWFFLAGGGDPDRDGAADAAAEAEEERDALYLDLGRFLVNFDHRGSIRYVQTEMQLMARSQTMIDKAERNRPALRNRVIMLLSGQDFEALRTVEGKEQLRRDALAAVNDTLKASGEDAVEAVFFTAFVLQ